MKRFAPAAIVLVAAGAVWIAGARRWPDDRRVRLTAPAQAAAPGWRMVRDMAERPGAYKPPSGARGADQSAPEFALVSLGNERWNVTRRALPALPGSSWTFELDVPKEAEWRGFCGAPSGRVVFRVEVNPGDGWTTAAEVSAGGSGARGWFLWAAGREPPSPWRPLSVDLSRWGGRRISMRLSSDSPDGASGAWGSPAVWAKTGEPARTPVFLFVFGSLRADSVGLPREHQARMPHIDRLLREGASFSRFYTTSVVTLRAWNDLFSPGGPSAPSLAEHFRRAGYHTAAFGPVPASTSAALSGFDEVHRRHESVYDVPLSAREALAWAASMGDAPVFAVLYFGDRPATPAPWRYWLRTAAWPVGGGEGWRRWAYDARIAMLDHYAGRVAGGLERVGFFERALVSVVSLRGASLRLERVLRLPSLAPDDTSVAGAGFGLSEGGVRAVWGVRGPGVPPLRPSAEYAQLGDVAPTLASFARIASPPEWKGAVRRSEPAPRRADKRPEPRPVVEISDVGGRAVLLDGHYKWIRRAAPSELRVPSYLGPAERVLAGLQKEELFDLWDDPEERRDVSAERRDVLARLRRVAGDETGSETRVLMIPADAVVSGAVQFPQGAPDRIAASVPLRESPWAQYDFEVSGSSAVLSFRTASPSAPFVFRARLGQRPFPPEAVRVSKLGIPLIERGSADWYDQNRFPWMMGASSPLPGEEGPLLFLGKPSVSDGIPPP